MTTMYLTPAKESELISFSHICIDDALQKLGELVNINSFSANFAGVNRVQDKLQSWLAELGMEVQRLSAPGAADAVLAFTRCRATRRVALIGHADTVHPPENGFTTLTVDGDIARGPGAYDMKGGIVVMLMALTALRRAGLLHAVPITVCIVGDEETGSDWSENLLYEVAEDALAGLDFEFGRDNGKVVTRRQGISNYRFEARGRASHAGNAHKEGINAIEALCRVALAIQAKTDYEKPVTTNVGLIKGGSASNTVPDYAEMVCEVRGNRREDLQALEDFLPALTAPQFAGGAKINFARIHHTPPLEESADSRRLFEALKAAAARAGQTLEVYPAVSGGASDANFLGARGVPVVDGLGPDGGGAHSLTEHIIISSMPARIAATALYLAGLAQDNAGLDEERCAGKWRQEKKGSTRISAV